MMMADVNQADDHWRLNVVIVGTSTAAAAAAYRAFAVHLQRPAERYSDA